MEEQSIEKLIEEKTSIKVIYYIYQCIYLI